MPELQHPLPTTTFLPLQRKSLARYVAHGTPPQTAVEQAGLMAAQLCRTRLHPAAEIERLLHDACALFAGNEGAAAQLAGPGGGGQPGRGPTIIPPREPVTPLVRRETVIPTKGTKEVPLPDRQADPFAKLYADLLANAQQQKDQYRYINYDPEQIMNAAMSGFRRRGAMRSLQGY